MNQLALMLTAYLALVGQPDNLRPVGDDEWQSYKLAYDKSYENQQIESLRRSVYAVNKAKLETKQAQLKQSNASYEIGINKFTDWTQDEFKRIQGLRPIATDDIKQREHDVYLKNILETNEAAPLPDAFDWRTVAGRVTGVKNQMQCGSCWAFAAVGALEGQEKAVNMSKLVALSEQNVVDCAYASFGGAGCQGGRMIDAYAYMSIAGVDDSDSYPYKGVDGSCNFDKSKAVMKDTGFVVLPSDEEKIQKVLHQFGPVSVGIDSSDLQAYKQGIVDTECGSLNRIDHGVLLVGWGKDPKFGDFWIVKNSWGEYWGEDGYFRLVRGTGAACVDLQASIPRL